LGSRFKRFPIWYGQTRIAQGAVGFDEVRGRIHNYFMHFRKFPFARFVKSAALGLTWGLVFVARMPAATVKVSPSADTFLPEFASHFPGATGSVQDMVIGTQGPNAGLTKNRG
jgi:hypothetical protein